jgi:rhodanese-related sulfurtransferase
MSQLQQRFTELDPNTQYYLLCKVGARSYECAGFLREQGFKYVKNIKGGTDAWAKEIDPRMPRY